MKRCLRGCFLFCALCVWAQPPSSSPGTSGSGTPNSGTSAQNGPGKTSGQSSTAQSSPRSSSPRSTSQDSSNQDSSDQNPSQQSPSTSNSSAQAGAAPEDQESSSRDTLTDIGPPADDAKDHPNSKEAVSDLVPPPPGETTGVLEFHPWNPHKAQKDVEVGDYYFKRKNYKGALDRYKEALYYKENDAVATYRLAVCEEKMGDKAEARKNYEQYLKILPEGPFAQDAHAALAKLADKTSQ